MEDMNKGLSKEEFDSLSRNDQEFLAAKALAWFCAVNYFIPFSADAPAEVSVIKIILGKFRGGKE